MSSSTTVATPRPLLRDPRRLLLAAAGVVCVALGAIGAVVPGMPTTVFLIVASYCFTRSCPWLEQRLLRNAFFARYMRFVDDGTPMPRRARIAALTAMWVSTSASLAILSASGRLGYVGAAVIVSAALVGTVAILMVRRARGGDAERVAGPAGD